MKKQGEELSLEGEFFFVVIRQEVGDVVHKVTDP
jgi:hypothetical protein